MTSECPSPLVCRLDYCRAECRETRDCPGGVECVFDEQGLGACQLPAETQCVLTSECPEGLVCRFANCTNACVDHRDCPVGSACVADGEAPADGGEPPRGCKDETEFDCILNSDCPNPLHICALDHRCREQCREDRDCRDGLACLSDVSGVMLCGVPPVDGGVDGGVTNPGRVAPFPATLVGGSQHTCFYDATLGLRCWGDDTYTQRGGSSLATPVTIDPVQVIGVGPFHTCARTAADLFCWGRNDTGQLGLGTSGTPVGTPQPVRVPVTMTPILAAAITGGGAHTCVIDASNVTWCWGDNSRGQLATDPMATPSSNVPVQVTGLAGTPIQVTARGNHTCVLYANGTAQCWGDNTVGQLGNGTTSASPTPTPQTVMGLTTAAELVGGTLHTCARLADGQVVCWGDNASGQMGTGTAGGTITSPATAVTLPAAAVELAAGSAHTCAVVDPATEQVYCWGYNFDGQCGADPTIFGNDSIETPVLVPGLGAIDELAVGENHSCARDGTAVSCWGQNILGQLDGTPGAASFTPLPVTFP